MKSIFILALAILFVVCVFDACSTRRASIPKSDITEFARNYAKAWSSDDPNNLTAFYSANASLQVNDDKPAIGHAAIVKAARGLMKAFPDRVITMDKVVDKGSLIEFHWTLDGRNTGPRGTGNRVRISGYEEWRFGPDGLIVEAKSYLPEDEYKRQLEHGFQE